MREREREREMRKREIREEREEERERDQRERKREREIRERESEREGWGEYVGVFLATDNFSSQLYFLKAIWAFTDLEDERVNASPYTRNHF